MDRAIGAYLGTHLFGHGFLLITRVDGDDLETHSPGVLLSQRTKTTTSTNDGNSLTWLGTRFLQTLVHSDTRTKNWRYLIERNTIWNVSNMLGRRNGVLLE